MLLEEVFEHILREQPHHLAEVLGEVYLTDMANNVCQTVLGDVGFTLGNQCLQLLAIRHRLDKEFGAALCAFPLCEPLILTLNEYTRAVPQIHWSDRSDDDTFADVVLDSWQSQPLSNLALESVRLLQALIQSSSEEGLGIKETTGLKDLVDLINREEPSTLLSKEVDVEAIKLMVGSI